MRLSHDLYQFLVAEHDFIVDFSHREGMLRRSSTGVNRFFLTEVETRYRPTAIFCTLGQHPQGDEKEGFYLFDAVGNDQVGQFFKWPAVDNHSSMAVYHFYRPHRERKYSIVTVKAEEGLPDMFTIVVDHDGEWLPRFLELEDLPALFKSQVYARDELSQPPEAGYPLFNVYEDLFYGDANHFHSGAGWQENREEFVIVFFDDASMRRFVNDHSDGWSVYGRSNSRSTRGAHFSVRPFQDTCHLRRAVMKATGFTRDLRRAQWALVQYKVDSALFDARSGPFAIEGSKSTELTEGELDEALLSARQEGTILSKNSFFLIDVFKLAYDSDDLDYWVIVGGYWRAIDLPDGVSWRSSRMINRPCTVSQASRRSYMPRNPAYSICPSYRLPAMASGMHCQIDSHQLAEKLKPLRKTLFWHKGHTFVNYFRSLSSAYH